MLPVQIPKVRNLNLVKKKKSKLQKRKDDFNSSYYRKICDELVRKLTFIRDNGKCIICDSIKLPNAHHLINRHHYGTRWEYQGQVLLCSLHHKFSKIMSAHGTPINFSEWLRINRPDQYQWVLDNINKELKMTYKEKAEELKSLLNLKKD